MRPSPKGERLNRIRWHHQLLGHVLERVFDLYCLHQATAGILIPCIEPWTKCEWDWGNLFN